MTSLENFRCIWWHFIFSNFPSRFFSSYHNEKRTELHHNCPISHQHHHGGILIEFAFSVPIIISLLFFVSDHYRFYELKDKVKSSAYLVASMVQQIGNTKENKQLTKSDLAYISYASCLNLFHTNTMFNPWQFGIYYAMLCHYVKRINSNNYQYQYNCATMSTGNAPNNNSMFLNCSSGSKSLAQVKNMHPDLVCDKDGDERVLITTHYRKANKFNKNKLGFFILDPRISTSVDGMTNNFFTYEVVITPKPGLFPVKSD